MMELCRGWWGRKFVITPSGKFPSPPPLTLAKMSEHQLLTDSISLQVQGLHVFILFFRGLFHGSCHWRRPNIHPMLQGDVVEDTTSQDNVAGLLWWVLQRSLGSIQAAKSGAEGSESLLNHTVSCRMGHIIAIFGWGFRNVKGGHEPSTQREGTVTCGGRSKEIVNHPNWTTNRNENPGTYTQNG